MVGGFKHLPWGGRFGSTHNPAMFSNEITTHAILQLSFPALHFRNFHNWQRLALWWVFISGLGHHQILRLRNPQKLEAKLMGPSHTLMCWPCCVRTGFRSKFGAVQTWYLGASLLMVSPAADVRQNLYPWAARDLGPHVDSHGWTWPWNGESFPV